jgi:hypothetical protein
VQRGPPKNEWTCIQAKAGASRLFQQHKARVSQRHRRCRCFAGHGLPQHNTTRHSLPQTLHQLLRLWRGPDRDVRHRHHHPGGLLHRGASGRPTALALRSAPSSHPLRGPCSSRSRLGRGRLRCSCSGHGGLPFRQRRGARPQHTPYGPSRGPGPHGCGCGGGSGLEGGSGGGGGDGGSACCCSCRWHCLLLLLRCSSGHGGRGAGGGDRGQAGGC